MGQSSDQIREEIDRTRDNAAGKIDQLQDQVRGTADDMRAQVQGTAQDVADQVKGTVDQTIDSVKENMDLKQQIEDRPLVALGAALLGGFVLGGMMGGGQHQSSHSQSQHREFSSGTPVGEGAGGARAMSGIRGAVQKSGLEDTISSAAAALMGAVTDQLKGTLDRNFPGFADKMDTAQERSGSFTDKAKATTSTSA